MIERKWISRKEAEKFYPNTGNIRAEVGLDYDEREALKAKGWERFTQCETDQEKADVLLNFIVPAHYWRARENLESVEGSRDHLKKIRGKDYYSHYVLEIDHYTENWIASQINNPRITKGIFDELCKRYEPKLNKYMPIGHTEYQL